MRTACTAPTTITAQAPPTTKARDLAKLLLSAPEWLRTSAATPMGSAMNGARKAA
jgi:hypothetical protein